MAITKTNYRLTLLPALLLAQILACGTEQSGPPRLDEPLGPGQVRAGVITRESELLKGVEAHGWLGDYKLYNSRVAFIVENITQPRGWGPYGGTLIDADFVPENDGGEELFQEIFPLIDWMTLYPLQAEIVSDGSDGGPAVLRISGEHRGVPLLDAALNGAFSPKDIALEQEYILEPDVDYLLLRLKIRSTTLSDVYISVSDFVMNGDRTENFFPRAGKSNEPSGQPEYFAGVARKVCNLYAPVAGPIQSAITIEGLSPLQVASGKAPFDPQAEPFTVERLLILGRGGLDGCLSTLARIRGENNWGVVEGQVSAAASPEEAEIQAYDKNLPAGSDFVNQTFADGEGRFHISLPAGSYRLTASAPGRETLEATVEVQAGQTSTINFDFPAPARLKVSCGEDPGGGKLPCKLSLQSGLAATMDAPVRTDLISFFPSGEGEVIVPVGDWTATLSRGWEYNIHRESFSIEAGKSYSINAKLHRQVDTSGYIAADLHNHSTRSADSDFEIKDKIASNACEGVELVILTDHDCQSDFSPQLQEMIAELNFDFSAWMRLVTGNEVSPMYAHHTAFPLPSHPTGWIYWQVPWTLYEDGRFVRYLEYPEILPRDRELGARVINIAHPLAESGYFAYLGFDPPNTIPRLSELDPAKFSADFDTIELLNGKGVDAMLGKNLQLWSSLNNQGLLRCASGVSDTHSRTGEAGFGRTMVASSTDDPAKMNLDEIWRNLKERRALVGAGVFVTLEIDGKGPGEMAIASGGKVTARVRVQAADWVPVQEVYLMLNGEARPALALSGPGELDASQPALRLDESIELTLDKDAWVAAVAYGPPEATLNPVFRGARPAGATNAVLVDVDGNGRFDPPEP